LLFAGRELRLKNAYVEGAFVMVQHSPEICLIPKSWGDAPMVIARLKYAVVLLVLVCNAEAFAEVILIPPDLLPGQQYRLAFVTSGSRDALSSNIEDYNTFVTNQAALNSALNSITTWRAIGSTATVAARDNTGTNPSSVGVPIYRLDGVRIADNNADLWDGAIHDLLNIDQFGMMQSHIVVWSGTYPDGSVVLPAALGDLYPMAGRTIDKDLLWVTAFSDNQQASNPIYGLSSVLTAAPEPSSTLLVGIGTCVWLFARHRQKTNS
jgi:hypothetical protein